MSVEWIVKSLCYRRDGDGVMVVDHFNDEDILSEFCHEDPEEVLQVLEIGHHPLSIADVTEKYVPHVVPSQFDREASRSDRLRSERLEAAE